MKPKGGFILHDHYAVVFHAIGQPDIRNRQIMNEKQWLALLEMTQPGNAHFVVDECWDITKGKCVSN